MSSTEENTKLIEWKRLWQLVSGIHYETPNDIVKSKLLDVSKELQDGIKQFQKCSSSSADLEKLLKTKRQEKLFPFTNKLQQLLDIESEQCWNILCFYLLNEYRGSVHSLSNFISTETNMTKLLDDIWGYYSLERMIVLKIVKNILEFHRSPGHPYHNEYKSVVDKLTLVKLRKSYIEQFEYLIKENPPNRLVSGEFINYQIKLVAWAERNSKEINEILHILIILINYDGIETIEIKKLFDCFKLHSFGQQQRYLDTTNDFHKELMMKVTYSETILFLRCIDLNMSHNIDTSWIAKLVDVLDKQIMQLHQNSEHGPYLLSWMLLNYRLINDYDEIAMHKYRQFGVRAVQLNVFDYLHKLISHHMFKDNSLVSRISRKTIYNHLSHLCDLFDADSSIGRHPNIYDLLCEIISWPPIATEFCKNEEGGVRSLYDTALENFPIDFTSLSMIAQGLSTSGSSGNDYIKNQLENLPIYTEIYDNEKFNLRPSNESDDEFLLIHDYAPFRNIDYVIPENTSVILTHKFGRPFVHFRYNVNYFNVLHNELNLFLTEAIQCQEINENRLKRINIGIKYLSIAIKNIKEPSEISYEMIHPTEMVIDILNKLKNIQNPPLEILANCLNVCTALLPLFEKEIITRVINLNILPYMTSENLDFKKYSHGVCFDSNLVGYYLINFEKTTEKYEFLLSYLEFLRTYTKLGKNNLFAIEIPGIIFLIREVFPHIHSWRFKSNEDKNKIYTFVMQYFFDILQISSEQIKQSENNEILRNICVYSLLNLDNGIVLLKFVAIGNPFLQALMENETNWISPPKTSYNFLVQFSMTILMQLLRLKTTIFESTLLSPLESLIYTQPKQRDTLRIIPVVTGYMNNIFNKRLPILSCRLLRRIAIEFNMSLLACLDMEPDQIRLTFLQRLPDDLESDNLKVAILEFVEACVQKQPGLTEAFFKMNHEKEKRFLVKQKKTTNIGDSILTYMEDYLEAILNNPKTVESLLPSRIMSLFHTLWKNNMHLLVKDLMKKPTFWTSLCNPLFVKITNNKRAYSQLFNIIGIQIFRCNENVKINNEMKKVLDKFFDPELFETYIINILNLPKSTIDDRIEDEVPEWLCQLQSFKDLIIIILRKNIDGLEISEKSLKILIKHCFRVLVERIQYTDDFRPLIMLSELYLFIYLNFKTKYTETSTEDHEIFQELVKFLCNLALYYKDIHFRARESCLAITIKLIDMLSDELKIDTIFSLNFKQSIIDIVCIELKCLELNVKNGNKIETKDILNENSLKLCLNLLKKIIIIYHDDGPINWELPFISNRIISQLLNCTSLILQKSIKHNLSVELLDVLVEFAKGNCSAEFLYYDISEHLWLKLLPPKELLQAPYVLQQSKENSWIAQNWWPIYSRGIELITVLLKQHKYNFINNVLIFVGIHEEYLMDSILLSKQSLEPNAMILIKNAVQLISELVSYEKIWRLEHSKSLFNLMRSIQMLMDYSISLLYRPKILKRLADGANFQNDTLLETTNPLAFEDMITALNDITELIISSAKCLLSFSPKLIELIAEPEFLACKWEPLIEIQFGAPKLDAGNFPQLTFGSVLSAVSIFTKSLNLQNYTSQEIPLIKLPNEIKKNAGNGSISNVEIGSVTRSQTTSTSIPSTPIRSNSRTPFLKSQSITSSVNSLMSSVAPANEFLSNLDSDLCLMALEHILTLLASQSLLALKNTNLSNREKQLIRREISTELLIYHDFVRKKVLIEQKEMWHRKKYGILMMMDFEDDNLYDENKSKHHISSRRVSDHKNSMRVNVVRRLHLQQHPKATTSKKSFEMSQVLSPIQSVSSHNKTILNIPAESSTPYQRETTIRKHSNDDYSFKKICTEDEQVYFEPDEPKYSPLSYVKLVEEDYLHFLSNLFIVICQSD